jgi:predicted PurR-regulated permease PerM
LLVTTIPQGAIAGAGFAVFHVEASVLLAMLTAVASIIPILGTFLIRGSASAWLVATGHVWAALGLFAWGVVLVHSADNILRPLPICTSTRLPFLLVMFGVIGGLAAFGLVGLTIGPVVLAIATAVWREWADQARASSTHGSKSRPCAAVPSPPGSLCNLRAPPEVTL